MIQVLWGYKFSEITGFREIEGVIEVTDSILCLISYDSLTMGPRFYMQDCVFELRNGIYKCRIVQMDDPESDDYHPKMDFLIELRLSDDYVETWSYIPWFESEFDEQAM